MKKIVFKGSSNGTNNNKGFKHKKTVVTNHTINIGGGGSVNSPYTVIVGKNGLVTGGHKDAGATLVLGHNNVAHSADDVIIVGPENIVIQANNVTCNGSKNVISGSYHSVTGIENTIGKGTSYCFILGSFNTIPDNLTNVTIIGSNITATQSYSYIVAQAPQQPQVN